MIYFLIPAFEEEGTIGLLLYKIRQVMRDVRRDYLAIVLDDGSTDETGAVAERYQRFLPVKVLRHAENRGFGPSLDRLVREAARLSRFPERDLAIVLEGDFSWSPETVPDMVRAVEAGADVVIGTPAPRMPQTDAPPRGVRWSGRIVSTVLRAIMPVPHVTDYTSTFRAYRIAALKRAITTFQEGLLTSAGVAANAELLLRLSCFHPAVAEVPARCRYDIRPRGSRHQWRRAVRAHLGLTGRVERAARGPQGASA